VAVSHISHFGAVVTLYILVQRIIPSNETVKQRIAFTAACLHVLSPAGLFLSSPYGESTFAFTAFLGVLCYICAQEHNHLPTQQSALPCAAWTILSGLSFASSTLVRSNGLLHGTIFLIDAFITLRALLVTRKAAHLLHLLSIIIAGTLIAFAFALPQAIAYTEFCTASNSRPWCTRTIPSIYSWVQKHYWNVGFLSYWTPGNIPLFLLAAPMLAVLSATALSVCLAPDQILTSITGDTRQPTSTAETALFTHVAFQLALPQLILAIMALTSFHVQIINRISSGCALWYFVLAIAVNDRRAGRFEGAWGLLRESRAKLVVRLMVGYAIVQGGLYASFLPPA
jgi:phosphatidylinositol glycan class V